MISPPETSISAPLLFILYAASQTLYYVIAALVMKISGATAFNLSILTADFYSLIIGIFLFHYKVINLHLMTKKSQNFISCWKTYKKVDYSISIRKNSSDYYTDWLSYSWVFHLIHSWNSLFFQKLNLNCGLWWKKLQIPIPKSWLHFYGLNFSSMGKSVTPAFYFFISQLGPKCREDKINEISSLSTSCVRM